MSKSIQFPNVNIKPIKFKPTKYNPASVDHIYNTTYKFANSLLNYRDTKDDKIKNVIECAKFLVNNFYGHSLDGQPNLERAAYKPTKSSLNEKKKYLDFYKDHKEKFKELILDSGIEVFNTSVIDQYINNNAFEMLGVAHDISTGELSKELMGEIFSYLKFNDF